MLHLVFCFAKVASESATQHGLIKKFTNIQVDNWYQVSAK